MRSIFHASPVNPPFEDPSLYVDIPWEKRAVLFDLGANDDVPARRLLKLTDVFVSHAHIDHFIGFDHLLRYRLGRDAPLRLFGPEGITERVAAKLAGYTWNLVEEYSFRIEVHEIDDRRRRRTAMVARDRFRPVPLDEEAFEGGATPVRTILEDDVLTARAVILDHRIPCAAYSIEEPRHVNVNRDALVRRGLAPGPWLRELKRAVKEEADDATPIAVPGRGPVPLGELRQAIVSVHPGQKLAYVVDAAFHEENVRRIVALAEGADVLYCEAPFLERDRERAEATAHLTALAAGWIARQAGVARLEVLHFSPRYEREPEALREEAERAFRGEIEPSRPARAE